MSTLVFEGPHSLTIYSISLNIKFILIPFKLCKAKSATHFAFLTCLLSILPYPLYSSRDLLDPSCLPHASFFQTRASITLVIQGSVLLSALPFTPTETSRPCTLASSLCKASHFPGIPLPVNNSVHSPFASCRLIPSTFALSQFRTLTWIRSPFYHNYFKTVWIINVNIPRKTQMYT